MRRGKGRGGEWHLVWGSMAKTPKVLCVEDTPGPIPHSQNPGSPQAQGCLPTAPAQLTVSITGSVPEAFSSDEVRDTGELSPW